jgi:hypothetical protein
MNKLRRFPLALSILAIKTFVNRQLASCVVRPSVRQSLSFHNVIYSAMIYQISTNKFQMTQKIQLPFKMVSSTDITNFLKWPVLVKSVSG